MQSSPEDRRRTSDEEKARVGTEGKEHAAAGGSSTGLEPNVAGLLCYLGFWITGIVFLIIEQKDHYVRFHALQSIVTFGALTVAAVLLGWMPYIGTFFGAVIGIIAAVLWILLMVKAHQGELYKLPLAGQVAEEIVPAGWRVRTGGKEEGEGIPESGTGAGTAQPAPAQGTGYTSLSKGADAPARQKDDSSRTVRTDRVAGYAVVILLNVAAIIFFCFFHKYIAWYSVGPDGGVTRLQILTDGYFTWLPVLVTALVISIAAQIALIIYDRYWLRETVQIALTAIGVAVVANLLAIFPFDFSVIPNATLSEIMPVAVTIVLILIAVGLGVGALVRFIKLMVTVS